MMLTVFVRTHCDVCESAGVYELDSEGNTNTVVCHVDWSQALCSVCVGGGGGGGAITSFYMQN